MIVHDAKRSNHGPFHQKSSCFSSFSLMLSHEVLSVSRDIAPSEIWDDDFEFQKNNERDQKGEDDGALRLETIETPSKGSRWEMTDSTYDDYTGKGEYWIIKISYSTFLDQLCFRPWSFSYT